MRELRELCGCGATLRQKKEGGPGQAAFRCESQWDSEQPAHRRLLPASNEPQDKNLVAAWRAPQREV